MNDPVDGKPSSSPAAEHDTDLVPREAAAPPKPEHREVLSEAVAIEALVPLAVIDDDEHLIRYFDEQAEEHQCPKGSKRRLRRKRSLLIRKMEPLTALAFAAIAASAALVIIILFRALGKI